VTSQKKRP